MFRFFASTWAPSQETVQWHGVNMELFVWGGLGEICNSSALPGSHPYPTSKEDTPDIRTIPSVFSFSQAPAPGAIRLLEPFCLISYIQQSESTPCSISQQCLCCVYLLQHFNFVAVNSWKSHNICPRETTAFKFIWSSLLEDTAKVLWWLEGCLCGLCEFSVQNILLPNI